MINEILLMSVMISLVIAQDSIAKPEVLEAMDPYPLAHALDPDYEVDPLEGVRKRSEQPVGQPRDCSDVQVEAARAGTIAPSGVYTIYPPSCNMCFYNVWCDMENEGGGWTVISRRTNGTTDFYRGQYYYKMGFGDVSAEYHLGNQRISQLTMWKSYEMKICMTDVGDVKSEAGYSHFVVYNMSTHFTMKYDSYYGDAGDYLKNSNNSKFSTFDNDHDGAPQNCAKYFHSAWWYHTYGQNCGSQSNLFGYYFLGRKELPHFAGPGISWKPVPGPGGPAIKSMEMKIRPMGFLGWDIMPQRQLPDFDGLPPRRT